MDYSHIAMERAESLGADYADIRIQKTRSESVFLRNLSLKDTSDEIIHGYGIRVLKNGAWGFAHNNIFENKAVENTVAKAFEIASASARVKAGEGVKLARERSYMDSFKSPRVLDPFSVPVKEKIDLMLEVNKILLNHEPIKQAMFLLRIRKDEKKFVSSEGSDIDIDVVYIDPMIIATAVTEEDSQSRMYNPGGKAVGWEWIPGLDLTNRARQVAEEAIMKVRADELCEERRRDLILDPFNLSLTIHESVGHPTESDRVLGWEADMAGVSFATQEKLKNFRYGSEIVNLVADNTLEGGLATLGYDDDGVPCQKWHIVKDGILNEYGTTRETAPLVGETMSRGCSRATNYYDFPINRQPNLYLDAGKEELSPEDLIGGVEDGVYIEDRGSFSIDQHRVNFQFGGDLFWEIKNGKRTRMLKKVLYKSNNPEFWNSCYAICDKRFWRPFGIVNCGKGQPMQAGRMTHGAATALFKNIRVGGSQ